MSTKKSKTKENNENLHPIDRKRIRSGQSTDLSHTTWKVAKLDTVSSPTSLNAEILEEMGIGMLESDESTSSSASAIALVVSSSASADENSNEATPNLDAPKLRNQPYLMMRSANRTLDTSLDNGNSSLNESYDNTRLPVCGNNNGSNNNSKSTDIVRTENVDVTQSRKVAILGAGAGTNSIYQTVNINYSPGKHGRSPLATVTCNNMLSTGGVGNTLPQQQQSQTTNSTVNVSITQVIRLSPSALPSTSRQFTSGVQQQQQQHLVIAPTPCIVPCEEFFLYRNNANCNGWALDGKDHFSSLSDEIILQIFKWLPKKTLIRCSSVCRRFNRCASDESLWTRLDLGGRNLRAGALENILTRGVVILRLAQAELNHPVFETQFLINFPNFEAKLQYLDLSMVSVTKPSLKVLLSHCKNLKKLSLEHVPINDDICKEIGKNVNLEALNLAMCSGLEAWSVRTMLDALGNLNSLNISWTNLSVDAVTSLVTNASPSLMRLNVAGCRRTMFNSHLASLVKRCPNLLELDLSDCAGLTSNAINIICKFKMLEYLSLSRCYMIPAASYLELKNLSTLTYLDVFGILSATAMEMLEENCPNIGLNKFIHSSVARPTVGTRRTSIWGLRTRD